MFETNTIVSGIISHVGEANGIWVGLSMTESVRIMGTMTLSSDYCTMMAMSRRIGVSIRFGPQGPPLPEHPKITKSRTTLEAQVYDDDMIWVRNLLANTE